MPALLDEARAAPVGLLRLLGGRPDWPSAFRFTPQGFLRSFAGPLLALPLYVLAVAVVDRSGGVAATHGLGAAALAHLIDGLGFPLVMAVVAGVLGLRDGYAPFVVASNWAALYLNALLLASALLTDFGADGAALFAWASLLLLCLSVFLVWRLARETLTREIAPVALVVVLAVAWGVAADLLAHQVLG